MIFKKMKKIAKSHLGAEVTGAVISVPAYYNDLQREATRHAGALVIFQYCFHSSKPEKIRFNR